jgi:hypothetical protein
MAVPDLTGRIRPAGRIRYGRVAQILPVSHILPVNAARGTLQALADGWPPGPRRRTMLS